MKTKEALKLLSALAHESRLALMRRLIKAGPAGLSAGNLAAAEKLQPSTASAQLTILSNAGLVDHQRSGRQIIYRVKPDALTGFFAYLLRDCCAGDTSIAAEVGKICQHCK